MSIPTAPAPGEERTAHCLLDHAGRVLDAADADRPFYAASTIKLHVLLAALRAVDAGGLDLAARVTATSRFRGADGEVFALGGDHRDATHPPEGTPIAVRELLVRMIDRSSNEATDHVLSLVGLPAVAEEIARLGLTSTRVERMIGDASAIAAGATNETSAADLARTIRALVAGAPGPGGLEPRSRSLAREALRAQRIRVIADALRPDVEVGSKTGWVDDYRHDVAFLGDPDTTTVRYLAVMTAGRGQEAADAHIGRLVRALLPDLAR
ncbi:serine hydrolase [Brachybacterium phenoliresistens]|uniref:Beta-lactamase n=1 Tax=Brachybacterium phenoliresistens TaxID=396014 RepID=Z9JV02_9MICO|nr:serine hydrolase [Brachybacterium phenoliresistens]EWS81611.1 beta-lactamase [Brachybacterium phenoliresistens]